MQKTIAHLTTTPKEIIQFLGLIALLITSIWLGYRISPLAIALPILLVLVLVGGCWLIAKPVRLLFLYILLLPWHIALMTFLFGYLNLPASMVRVAAAWKEGLGLLIFGAVLIYVLTNNRFPGRITLTDGLVATMLILSTSYLLMADWLYQDAPPLIARLYGYRESVFFLLFYVIGRLMPISENSSKWILLLLGVSAFIVSSFGLFERFVIPLEAFLKFGVDRYYGEFLGWEHTTGPISGLPDNLWTVIGGQYFRRLGGGFFSAQGFAIPFLVLIPAVTFLTYGLQKKPSRGWLFVLLLSCAALLLSITRVTIIAAAVEMLVLAFVLRRYFLVRSLLMIGGLTVIMAVLIEPEFATFFTETLLFQTSSSYTHLQAWSSGLIAFLSHPFGYGLGFTDATAIRFDLPLLTGDNLFLKYLVELGLPGFISQILLLVGIFQGSWLAFRKSSHFSGQRGIVAIVLVTTLAIVINGQTAVVYNSNFLAYTYWWMAGSVIGWISNKARVISQNVDIA